jgi:hypothetical protein
VASKRERERRQKSYRNAVLKSAFKFTDDTNRSIQTAQLRVLVDIHELLDDIRDEVSKLAGRRG